jgi:hypothetical protein
MFVAGGDGSSTAGGASPCGLVGLLLSLLVGEKSGFGVSDDPDVAKLREFAEHLSDETMQTIFAEAQAGNQPPIRTVG